MIKIIYSYDVHESLKKHSDVLHLTEAGMELSRLDLAELDTSSPENVTLTVNGDFVKDVLDALSDSIPSVVSMLAALSFLGKSLLDRLDKICIRYSKKEEGTV